MFLFRAKRYPNSNVLVSGEDIEVISNYLYTKENDRASQAYLCRHAVKC